MGTYLNPPKSIFGDSTQSEIYVDKSGLLKHLNQWVLSDERYVCLTRPRRFGKSMAASMIAVYYCNAYDSHDLFNKLAIHRLKSYEQHINKYAVISFDAQSFRDRVNDAMAFVPMLHQIIGEEISSQWPECTSGLVNIVDMLIKINKTTGTQFVIIIDEWDSIFRRDKDNKTATKEWVKFLRSTFKSAEAKQYLALAYMTGILPIKKYDVESSLNLFDEYTMLSSVPLESYFGFTEKEVQKLCKRYKMDFEETKRWYDGYQITRDISIYNPRSATQAMRRKDFDVYWSQTGSFDVLKDYINMDFDGLKDAISQMLVGIHYPVDTTAFNTSLEITNRDHVLTALIHLGYLTYSFDEKAAWLPNQEIRNVMKTAITESNWEKTIQMMQRSQSFMDAILRKDCEQASTIMEEIHNDLSVPIHYNSEGDLTATLLFAVYEARNYCILGRELPSSHGYADVVLIPTRKGKYIPTIFQLKVDETTDSAIKQVEDRKYFAVKDLQNYHGQVLAVAMIYDRKHKQHQCSMRTFEI